MQSLPVLPILNDLVWPPAAMMTAEQRSQLYVERAPHIESRIQAVDSHAGVRRQPTEVAVVEMVDVFYPERTMRFIDAVNTAADAENVGALVVYINSPGGSSVFGPEANDAVWRASQAKPTIAVCEGLCTSLAYFVACGCREIVASPSTLVGSIGTRLTLIDSSKAFEQMGLKIIPIDTGKYKSAGSPGTPIDEGQIGYFQSIVDEIQKPFIAAVMRGRKMDARRVKDIADAAVYSAPQALGLKLIDRIATVNDAVAEFVRRVFPTPSPFEIAQAELAAKQESLKQSSYMPSKHWTAYR